MRFIVVIFAVLCSCKQSTTETAKNSVVTSNHGSGFQSGESKVISRLLFELRDKNFTFKIDTFYSKELEFPFILNGQSADTLIIKAKRVLQVKARQGLKRFVIQEIFLDKNTSILNVKDSIQNIIYNFDLRKDIWNEKIYDRLQSRADTLFYISTETKGYEDTMLLVHAQLRRILDENDYKTKY